MHQMSRKANIIAANYLDIMQGLELKQSLTTTLHLTLMVTIHSVCRRSVTTTDYDPSQDYPPARSDYTKTLYPLVQNHLL